MGLSILVIALAFMSISTPLVWFRHIMTLQRSLAVEYGITSEFVVLLLIFGFMNIVLPIVVSVGAASLGRMLTRMTKRDSVKDTLAAFAPAFVPLGFSIWFAHYTFHF